MKKFIIFDNAGKILRAGSCQDLDYKKQAQEGESILEGTANDITQKIVDGTVVDKTPEEIEADKPPEPELIPFEQRQANIINEQYQSILDRLVALENTAQ